MVGDKTSSHATPSLLSTSILQGNTRSSISTSWTSAMDQYHKSPHTSPTSSSRFHAVASFKPDKTTVPRFLRNLKCFFLDSWFDILCILVIAGIAGAVSLNSTHHSTLTSNKQPGLDHRSPSSSPLPSFLSRWRHIRARDLIPLPEEHILFTRSCSDLRLDSCRDHYSGTDLGQVLRRLLFWNSWSLV